MRHIKFKKYFFSIEILIISLALLGWAIKSEAVSNTYDYNKFQSKIDAYIGQDPNLKESYDSPYLSSSMLNINGPLQISVNWSDIYGATLETHYANLLSTTNAIAIEGSLGAMQNRINITLGHVFSPKNRIKITGERFAQKQTFDFYSGSIDEWVSQYAGGAELQHLISTGFFNNISAGGYYAQSGSKSLDPIVYDEGDAVFINYRHIAGATSTGGHISLGLKPWKTGMITFTSYYDAVNYNTQYSDISAEDSSTVGYGVKLEQYISQAIKATAEYSHRALYDTLQSGVQFFHNIRHNSAAIGVSLGYTHNNYNNNLIDDANSENIYAFGLQYYFMPIKDGYTMPKFNFQSLTVWASEPAVRMERVMAAADQEKISPAINWDSTLSFQPAGGNSEKISWNLATNPIDNDSFAYQLKVIDKNNNETVYNEDVSGKTFLTISSLKPNTTYIARMTITDSIFHKSQSSTNQEFTTAKSSIIWDSKLNVIDINSNQATLLWDKSPQPSSENDNISYYFTLNDGTKNIIENKKFSPSNNMFKITTNLNPNVQYVATIKVTDTKDIATSIGGGQQGDGSGIFTTKKGAIVWDGNIQSERDEPDQSTVHVNFSWSAATLNPSSNEDTLQYEYSIDAHYVGDSTRGSPIHDITRKGIQEKTSLDENFPKYYNDGYNLMQINWITIYVTAKDMQNDYVPISKNAKV